MSNRKNLNRKSDNSNFIPRQKPYSFYMNENDDEDEEKNTSLADNLQEISEDNNTSNNIEYENNRNVLNDSSNENISSSNISQKLFANKSKEMASIESKKTIIEMAKKTPIAKKITLITVLLLSFLLILILMIGAISDDNGSSGSMAIGGYYAMRCQDVTVYIADKSKGYEIVDTKTIPFEDYIAGVVAAEVGGFNNIEVYKEFALAARTFFLSHDDNCSIESSDRRQVYRETSNSLIYQAVEETKGQVILTDGQLQSVQYDAFCSIAVDDKEYTLKQANQKIPRSWADSQAGIASSWKQGTCAGNHGNGLSQWGSYYLASVLGYTYEELIPYYLGDNVSISSSKGFSTSIEGLEIKDTKDAQELHENLGMFLRNHGSSIEELNSFIKTNVKNNGAGTRAGVVTAAVSLINYLYDGGHIRLPYYWGGNYQFVGVNPNFGGQDAASVSIYGNAYYHTGFDCSGFVSWAIRNGGYNIPRYTTTGFHGAFSGNSCNMSDSSCIGQPGDLINASGCHVQMIVAVDEASNKYYIAESTGGYGLIMQEWNMHSGVCGSGSRIIHMDSFYENQGNVDTSY